MKQRLLGAELPSISGHAFTRLIERMLWHMGFEDVSNVDGSGDGGADLVATRAGRRWVFQAKSKRTTAVSGSAVDEVRDGMIAFNADRGVVVTNSRFAPSARTRCQELRLSSALQIDLWDRELLIRMASDPAFQVRFRQPDLRRYQVDAFQACMGDLKREGRAFAVLATGLGKTVIAGSVIDAVIDANPGARVLILANKTELVDQLEHAIWRHLPDDVPTQQINSLNHPEDLPGVTVATIQSAISYARRGFRPDFIFVDEAHNVSSDGLFRELISLCPDVPLLGATATPWRGDRFDVSAVFGEPSVAIGIEEGMRLGYLADVDYRLYTDNIDWSYIRSKSANNYTIGNLNRNLFLPQRDERIRDELLDVWQSTVRPRGIVFCRSIDHAEHLLGILRGVPAWSRAAAIHTGLLSRERKANLAKFRLGDVPLLVAVDVLNEGVDVPDVNIVCFARVTHSRKIFVQQLGRGLRLSQGKSHVTVLDFVSDLRRVKAILDLKTVVGASRESIYLPSSHTIEFQDSGAEDLFREWLKDVASLETAAEEAALNFPPFDDLS